MSGVTRIRTATAMAFRDQWRRPLLLVLLILIPAYVIARSIAITEATPRQVGLPGGEVVLSTMREIHGAVMAGNVIAFVCGLVGVFTMQSSLLGDRRLVIAGYAPAEAMTARLLVVIAATAVVVAVSAVVTALYFEPEAWPVFLGGLVLIGLTYAALGAIAGSVLDKLAATYLMLFLAMTDLGIVQNPMFGDGDAGGWAAALPGWGAGQLMVEGAFAGGFGASAELLAALAWLSALGVLTFAVLRRQLGPLA